MKLLAIFLLAILAACNPIDKGLFQIVTSNESGIDFINTLQEKPGLNILYYLYYYNGAGVAAGDINNDGLTDLYYASNSKGGNKLYLNKGNWKFEDITKKAGVEGIADWSTGVTMVDVNADGLLDIYVVAASGDFGLQGRNALYINKGNQTFEEKAENFGLAFSSLGTQAAFFDFDHDGDLDCYLLNHSKRPNANLVPAQNRSKPDSINGDRLLRNDLIETGTTKFIDVSAQAGIYRSSLGYGLGIAVADFNNDGWDDLYIGNDFHENDYLYLNNGDGTFLEKGKDFFSHFSRFSMGNDAGDINNDGLTDLVTVDMLPPDEKTLKTYGSDENLNSYLTKIVGNGYGHQVSRNSIQRNLGTGGFTDVALMGDAFATDWSWSPLLADYDNDGFTDLFISSGIVKRPVDMDYVMYVSALSQQKEMDKTDAYDKEAIDKMPDGATHPFFFKGDGNFGFKDVSEAWGTGKMKGYYNGAAWADFDNDGDIDLVTNNINSKSLLLKNNSIATNWLTINVEGDSPNKFGVGVRIKAYAGKDVFQRQLQTSKGFLSSCEQRIHIGLGSHTVVDSLLVIWPNQKVEWIKNITGNTEFKIQQKNAQNNLFIYSTIISSTIPTLPLQDVPGLTWKHEENPFLDFNRQYLIPHMQSILGPALATGDVDGNGLDDFFAGGAAGKSGTLMLQKSEGKFVPGNLSAFVQNADCEEVAATFFDADNNGTLDLYVVSGGGELDNGNPALADHLYLNDGKGNFRQSTDALPAFLTNKSCVMTFDFEKDGDKDLFVGGHVDAGVYGIAQKSFLLINNGKGQFELAGKEIVNLDSLGMVTTVATGDMNGDGYEDVVVGGEWMSLTILENKSGKKMEARQLPGSTGLWQCIYLDDVDNNGKLDIMAGNWGLNSKLAAGKDGPLKLYIKDFDKNGRVEQIMTYNIGGNEYPFYAKDELEKAVPELKKYYLSYGEVAGKTVQYLFFNLFEGYKEWKAEKLASGIFFNTGSMNFNWTAFPFDWQLAPMMAIQSTGKGQWIGAGNFTGVMPYEGRYDAMAGFLFNYDVAQKQFVIQDRIQTRGLDVRKIVSLKSGNKNELLFGINNKGVSRVELPK